MGRGDGNEVTVSSNGGEGGLPHRMVALNCSSSNIT